MKHIDTVNRLSNNKINILHRDRDGFLWIGTSVGLYRYDGYEFKRYAPTDTATHPQYSYDIKHIHETADGRMWINNGLEFSVYDPETDRIVTDIAPLLREFGFEFKPSHIHIDNNNTLWIHSVGNGLFKIDIAKKTCEKIKDKEFDSVILTDFISTPTGVMTIDSEGIIRLVDPVKLNTKLKDSHIYDTYSSNRSDFMISYDRDGLCWIFNNEHLWVYDFAQKQWLDQLLPGGGREQKVKVFLQDRSGKCWICRDHYGLEIVEKRPTAITFRRMPISTSSDLIPTITSLYEDEGGTMWVGSYKKGLYYFNSNIRKFDLRQLPDVNCVLPSLSDSKVWVGTDNAGLLKWNPADNSHVTAASAKELAGAVTALHEDNDGTLYIGSYSDGLKRYRDGRIETIHTDSDLDKAYTWAIAEDGNSSLWIGTLGSGLFHLNPATMQQTLYDTSNSGIASDCIFKIIDDKKGHVYIATSLGVSIFNPAKRSFKSIPQLESTSINDILLDSRGLLWIASARGLTAYDPSHSRLTHIDFGHPHIHPDFILGLCEDKQDKLWISEGGELINLDILLDEKTGKISYTRHTYDAADGLQDSDFNQRSFGVLPSGEILVGGFYGLSTFFPDRIAHNRNLPKVIISDIYAGKQPIAIGEEVEGHILLKKSPNHGGKLELWPDNHSFTVYFASDDHLLPQKTVFHYKLEGFDKNFINTRPGANYVTYTNLPPGSYTLIVKAINNDGYESASPTELKIEIHPPLWLSVWAKALYIAAIALAIYLIFRFMRHREQLRFKEKLRQDALKKQEEVNSIKFKFYTNVSHELRTPLTLILSPLESMIKETSEPAQLKRLTLMRNNAMRLLMLVNQLLDFRKNEVAGLSLHLSEGELTAFVRNVCHSFANLSERKNIRLNFSSNVRELNLMFDEDKLCKTIMNLLSNAFKFTPEGGEVSVKVTTGKDSVEISVADNGIGISDSDKAHIFERFYQAENHPADSVFTGNGIGLSMASEYIKLHNGTISVADNPGGGSVFRIELPLIKHKADLPPSKLSVEESFMSESYKDVAPEAETSKSGPHPASPIKFDKPAVLIVDDSPDMIEFLRESLSNDYHVLTASNGESALSLLDTIRPVIILTDLMMPGMDGVELCRRIKADRSTASIPVIIITAKHDMSAKMEGLTLGADDYVTKPFSMDLLLLRMKKLIELTATRSDKLIDPEPDSIKITPLDEKMVEKAVKYVVANIKRPELSVEELSAHLGMSRVHLYKKLKATTGKTPVEFIRLIRLKRGAQMLRESQLNISEIAYQLGYNSPKYFSKYFRDEYGVLPSVYQEKEGKATNCPL